MIRNYIYKFCSNLTAEEISSYKKKNEKYISLIQKAFVSIIDTFNISIPDNELYFICEIIKEAERESKKYK